MRFTLFCLSSSAKRNKSLFLTMNTLNTLFLLILCICMGLVKVDENIPDEYLKYTGDAFYRFNRFPDFECAIELFKAIQYCSLSAAVSWKLIPKPKQKMKWLLRFVVFSSLFFKCYSRSMFANLYS